MELECGYSPQDKTIAILYFFGSPVPALALAKAAAGNSTLGRALQWHALASSPILQTPADYKLLHTHTHTYTHTHIYKDMHSPPHPRSLAWQAGLWPAPGMAAGPDGCLPELDYFPCCKVVCLWCMCLLLRCFSCSHTALPKEHSLGVIFFLLTFLMLHCIFLQFPVFLFCLPPCHICMLCMDRLMANFTGTCD